MTRTELLQELRQMRFQEAYGGWGERRLTQEEAARLLGVCERTFRRYVDRYEDEGLDGLVDKRLGQVSARRAPVDEVVRTETLYRERYDGWNVAHFYSFYRRRHGGERSYTWVKSTLQRAGLVAKAPGRGKHRRRRERAPLAGMMLHQDGSTHEWVAGAHWDLIITLDDATSEHYSMLFVAEEGTASSLRGMSEVIERWGLPSSLYTDRGPELADILCEHRERTVGRDNCVSFERKRLQIPAQAHRYHFVKARVRVHRSTPTSAWRCFTDRASSPSTSAMAPWWPTLPPRSTSIAHAVPARAQGEDLHSPARPPCTGTDSLPAPAPVICPAQWSVIGDCRQVIRLAADSAIGFAEMRSQAVRIDTPSVSMSALRLSATLAAETFTESCARWA